MDEEIEAELYGDDDGEEEESDDADDDEPAPRTRSSAPWTAAPRNGRELADFWRGEVPRVEDV